MDAIALPPTLNVKDVMGYFNTSKSTIERAITAGKLKCYKQGQIRKFKREWVLEYEAAIIAESQTDGEVNKDESTLRSDGRVYQG
jgi:excisionase family DNA binding protein